MTKKFCNVLTQNVKDGPLDPVYLIKIAKDKTRYEACCIFESHLKGTPTKRQVSKRQVSKRSVSKRLKRQVYKTSGLQNVRFTKCQVYKTSGVQNVRLKKKTSIYILYLWLVEIRRLCCSHVCRQSDGCVLFSIFKVFCHISP
jgi:hypothetical protein